MTGRQLTLAMEPAGSSGPATCTTAGCGRKPRAGGKRCQPCEAVATSSYQAGIAAGFVRRQNQRGKGAHYVRVGDELTTTDRRIGYVITMAGRHMCFREICWRLKKLWPEEYLGVDDHGLSGRVSEACGRGAVRMVEKVRILVDEDDEGSLVFRRVDEGGRTVDLYGLGDAYLAGIVPSEGATTDGIRYIDEREEVSP